MYTSCVCVPGVSVGKGVLVRGILRASSGTCLAPFSGSARQRQKATFRGTRPRARTRTRRRTWKSAGVAAGSWMHRSEAAQAALGHAMCSRVGVPKKNNIRRGVCGSAQGRVDAPRGVRVGLPQCMRSLSCCFQLLSRHFLSRPLLASTAASGHDVRPILCLSRVLQARSFRHLWHADAYYQCRRPRRQRNCPVSRSQ